ncbi:23S rRNA (adenine(2030)-N(6))-methyltransferase RlmJ [Methylovirgula sp. 4M-Z18]|uniref:23S rRNA (adenine(2030)-N(6))-methyltransferase RlmJ n=1 Tax=Methylovirgula sp. 4M-Z18 TaxID=2293567 RepID=UPI000E2ED891|nr:23S rRNA (adenine(2030)-N(6))-methyltransferase RlmJ [Methylovirgula sp. 4M-Z18]RFB78813.1 23S rRNA (adenine(2030)-N(6))-methyltransferase RlmJ [Methylovirgula sp. 4M-Z18]
MNYRHAFHAGNFADVFKHALLARIVSYLIKKDAPIFYLDTHAGIGLYDLSGEEATRTGEWRDGIARLATPGPEAINALLQPYLDAVGPLDTDGMPALYPGSPALVQALLRPQDRATLCDLHPVDAKLLAESIGRDKRMKVIEIDGYTALNAYVPPKERRGLVLIDPPFEEPNEFTRLVEAVTHAHRKWATGVYALWYPLKDMEQTGKFARKLAATGVRKILQLEIEIAPPQRDASALYGTGMMVINPPYQLEAEANVLLPWLAKRLARDNHHQARVDWLVPE